MRLEYTEKIYREILLARKKTNVQRMQSEFYIHISLLTSY